MVALWLGVFIPRVNLNTAGWGILLGWTLWLIVLPVTIEILGFILKEKKGFVQSFKKKFT